MVSEQDVSQPARCPVCDGRDVSLFVQIPQVPVHCNLLWPTREEAIQAPRGDTRLGFCGECGHIFNLAFDPRLMEYGGAYENSLHCSPRFQSYAESLAARLIDRHNLHGKDIIDIGCGQGDFLKLLCDLGGNRGVGFDPSYVPPQGVQATENERITFIQDFYSECYAGYGADLICCRQVLEHIQFPRDFLGTVRRSIGDRRGTIVFFEVPNVLFTLKDLGIWDLIYEHPSYYSPSSLARLFTDCGFQVRELREAYAGQFLGIEAAPHHDATDSVDDPGGDLQELAEYVTAFADNYRRRVETWRRHLEQVTGKGQRVVVWGSGSKGVTFLNTVKTQDRIEYVVDINPRKQDMYVGGTGQRIVPPQFLQDYQPDVVIIMNPIYQGEIQELARSLGLTAEFVSVLD